MGKDKKPAQGSKAPAPAPMVVAPLSGQDILANPELRYSSVGEAHERLVRTREEAHAVNMKNARIAQERAAIEAERQAQERARTLSRPPETMLDVRNSSVPPPMFVAQPPPAPPQPQPQPPPQPVMFPAPQPPRPTRVNAFMARRAAATKG